MKSYRVLAWKELLAQKVTSILILIAVILSTIITTVIGQSIGILNAMKEQQAIALAGEKYGSFVQLTEEQLAAIKSDSRFSYIGAAIDLGTIELNSQLRLSLVEYLDHSYEMYPAFTELLEGRLPEHPMEIALSEDVLRFLGFQGKSGDRISLTASKSWRHGILPAVDYTEEFTPYRNHEEQLCSLYLWHAPWYCGGGDGFPAVPVRADILCGGFLYRG